MPNYSITLNFFIPKTIVNKFNEIEISKPLSFDWREKEYCHCTVKPIALCDELPQQEIFDNWIIETQIVLASQKTFNINIQDISNFPTTIYAHVISDELTTLHKKLCTTLPISQPQFEEDNYLPHLSLGICKSSITNEIYIKQNFGEFIVNEIQLVSWNLNDLSNPKILHRFTLSEQL